MHTKRNSIYTSFFTPLFIVGRNSNLMSRLLCELFVKTTWKCSFKLNDNYIFIKENRTHNSSWKFIKFLFSQKSLWVSYQIMYTQYGKQWKLKYHMAVYRLEAKKNKYVLLNKLFVTMFFLYYVVKWVCKTVVTIFSYLFSAALLIVWTLICFSLMFFYC